MIVRPAFFRRICASAAVLGLAGPVPAGASPTLRSADIRIAMRSAGACDVTMTLAVDGGSAIDHRIEAAGDSRIDLSAVRGAAQLSPPRTVGRTLSLTLEPRIGTYELAYTVQGLQSHYRCPLWVPAAPADGVSRQVRIAVELPLGTSARATMPAFTWNRTRGTTTLGHIPAFVRVPFEPDGRTEIWDIPMIMDALTLVVFGGASGIWIWRRHR